MKNKHILIAFAASSAMVVIGAGLKINHMSGAAPLLLAGMALNGIAIFILAYKLVKSKSFKDFFES